MLTLVHDNLIAGEVYVLGRVDLRFVELISSDSSDASEIPDYTSFADTKRAPIDGLKVTIAGDELRALLEQQMRHHQDCAERWKREEARTPEEQTEEEPLLPEHMCENEADRHEWRQDVLAFIRDHIESAAVYRLGEADLAFGELLPGKPGWLEQDEYESEPALDSSLNDLRKESVG